MSLNESAEIVRKPETALDSHENSRNYVKAWELLANTTLSELDPTPISEEWLREGGARERGNMPGFFVFQGYDVDAMGDGEWMFDNDRTIQTLGELRTLLRLCAPKKENDA